jgi:two-component system NtrC family sensor kinase
MIAHKLLPLFALGLNVVLIASALASDRRNPLHRSFAYFATAEAVWNLGVLGLRWSDTPREALMWEVIVHLGVIPIPVLFYRYVVVFLGLSTRRSSLHAGYALCVLLLAVSPTPLFMAGVQWTYWGWAPLSGPLYYVFLVYFQAYSILGLIRLVRARRAQTSSFWRSRMLLVIVGVTLSLLGGAIDFLRFTPLGLERLYPLGIPANSLLALALGLAIVRYRLLDMGALAKRSLLYVSTSIAILPFLILADVLLRPFVPEGDLWRSLMAALILLLGFSMALPLLRLLERGLERVMFARQESVRAALLALSKDMASFLDVGALGRTLTGELVARIPIMRAALYLYNPATATLERSSEAVSPASARSSGGDLDGALALWLRRAARTMVVGEVALAGTGDPRGRALIRTLEAERVALLVPTFLEGELAAVLLLGEKLSGEIFSPEDIEILELLMGQTAIALKNAGLYQNLKDRMLELQAAQQQLLQSAKLAAIGELAASVAHEINKPLTVILGSSAVLLRKTQADAATYAKLTNIINAANRAGKIVRDLLDFSRRREPKHEAVVLNDLVRRALDIVQARLASGAVQVRTTLDPHLPLVTGDADQLTQVFVNLFTNAVDAMAGGGTLTVETSTLGADGVSVRVTDTGTGMDAGQIARIFEPFFTTKAEGKGTGLGLSVSLGIISKHGGNIEVDSEPGRGTSMRVRLPQRREVPAAVPVGGP